jgi:hypothetical protein
MTIGEARAQAMERTVKVWNSSFLPTETERLNFKT